MVPDIKQVIQYAAGEIAERVYSWDAQDWADDAGMEEAKRTTSEMAP